MGDNPRDAACSFCGRRRAVTGPMVEGPGGIFMCGPCVDAAGAIVARMRERGELPWVPSSPPSPDRPPMN